MAEQWLLLQYLILCQAASISVYASVKWCQHQLFVFQKFPEKQYPLFYVFNQKIEKVHLLVRVLLDVIALALVIAVCFFYLPQLKYMTPFIIWALVSFIQILPSLYSLVILRLAARKRRQQKRKGIVSVSTEARSIVDHLSLSNFLLLVLSFLLTINIILSNESLVLSKKIGLAVLLIGVCVLLCFTIFKAIYGRKNDKLLDENDRIDKRNKDVKQGIIGIASAIFIFALLGMQGTINTSSDWLLIPLSLFIQIAIVNRTKRWHADDMDVYRNP